MLELQKKGESETRYTEVWNGHRESKIHDIHEIGTKLLFTFLSLKVFRHKERERHNLSMLTAFTSSALNPTNARRP